MYYVYINGEKVVTSSSKKVGEFRLKNYKAEKEKELKKLAFGQLTNGQNVLVKSYKESKFVKVGELNEMTVKTEWTQNGWMVHLCTEKDGGIFGIPEKCFDKNVNNKTWIDIYEIN